MGLLSVTFDLHYVGSQHFVHLPQLFCDNASLYEPTQSTVCHIDL